VELVAHSASRANSSPNGGGVGARRRPLVEVLDVAPALLVVAASLVELSLSDILSSGIELGRPPLQRDRAQVASSSVGSRLGGLLSGGIELSLRAAPLLLTLSSSLRR
jgi:type II secretory pathway component GspD/PulD (secretin)